MQTPVVSRYPALAPIDDFVLLFLPPCSPHLTPLATGSLESGLLVSPLLGGPARHRPFAPTLHLHQCKSSCNLQLQYSAKSQSTPRCQSLITARSDHPPVLGCSGPQPRKERAAKVISDLLTITISSLHVVFLPLSERVQKQLPPKCFLCHAWGYQAKTQFLKN
jgi:hypothetical protein